MPAFVGIAAVQSSLETGDKHTMPSSPRFPIKNARVVSRYPEILRQCRGKKILHLGCADMPYTTERGEHLLHIQLSKVTPPENLWGIDISEEGIEHVRKMGFDNLILGNVEDMGQELRDMDFDIILAGEIIEHLDNPGLFLKSLKSIMTERTELMLTTYNANSFKGFLNAIMRREKVHPDHNYYFSNRTLKQLFQKFDLECTEVYYYQEIEGAGMSKFLDKAISLTTKFSPVWSDGVIVRAKLPARVVNSRLEASKQAQAV
jgi:2-polyprenyl-3-methyl-5-hydroxy-6-metoxy-1,4-benzoquinol methylase